VNCSLKSFSNVTSCFHCTITWSSIEPNSNLIHGSSNSRLEDVIQLSRWVPQIDWNVSSIHLPNVKWNLGQRGDLVSCVELTIGLKQYLDSIAIKHTLCLLGKKLELGMRVASAVIVA
jgi:hypothetical protein